MKVSISGNNRKRSKCVKEEDNVALASKGKTKGPSQGKGSRGEEKKNKDLSKFNCFSCDEFGHYST